MVSEQESERNDGMRNFKYLNTIKNVVEEECHGVVSCADIIALAAMEGTVMLGGPRIALKTGRRDSLQSSAAVTDKYMPPHNDTIDTVLDRFESIGIDAEGTVALLGNKESLKQGMRFGFEEMCETQDSILAMMEHEEDENNRCNKRNIRPNKPS